MLRSIDLSRAAMMRLGQTLDTAAHNVANINTAGFKAMRVALESGDVAPTTGDDATGTETPALTARLASARLQTQGDIQPTGSATDLAIEGEGLFIVRTRDGEAYTRNGGFVPDAEGRLTDGNGNLLQPGITVPPGTTSLRIAPDGTVGAVLEGGRIVPAGQVRLARFANANGLAARQDGLLTATAASGPAQSGGPGQGGLGRVHAGALEGSNVEMAGQMAELAGAQRQYQLNTTAFRMADDMLRMAAQLAGNS